VDRSIDADRVVAALDRLAFTRGAPAYVRFDNGPEFIAAAVADWCRFNGVDSVFIEPGSPWQNPWIESFNGRLRDELPSVRRWLRVRTCRWVRTISRRCRLSLSRRHWLA
jgi:putative transposase